VSRIAVVYRRGITENKAKSVADLVKEAQQKRDTAVEVEERRKNDHRMAQRNAAAGALTEAVRTRNKDPALRSRMEKKFLGFDMILHPEVTSSLLWREQQRPGCCQFVLI
jgi:hypothetical protein